MRTWRAFFAVVGGAFDSHTMPGVLHGQWRRAEGAAAGSLLGGGTPPFAAHRLRELIARRRGETRRHLLVHVTASRFIVGY